jgi:hypothetical protein
MRRADTASVAWLVTLTLVIAGLGGFAAYAGYRVWTELAGKPVAPEQTATTRPAAAAETVREPPAPSGRTRLPVPRLTAQDAARSAEEAYADLWSALRRGDGGAASKYVPAAKLATLESAEAVVDSFMGLSPIDELSPGKPATSGDKAVIFAKASSSAITDQKGKPSPIDVVVRMAREDGYWKVISQMWLVSTPPEKEQREAMAWLQAPAATGPQAQLEARGLRLDAGSFQSAVARGDVEQVRLFLAAGMSPRQKLDDGPSLLGLALLGSGPASEEIAIELIRGGADVVEEKTGSGMTPLIQAAFDCKPRVVSALLEKRVPLDVRDQHGRSALEWAKERSCPEAERLLRAAAGR